MFSNVVVDIDKLRRPFYKIFSSIDISATGPLRIISTCACSEEELADSALGSFFYSNS